MLGGEWGTVKGGVQIEKQEKNLLRISHLHFCDVKMNIVQSNLACLI